MLTPDLARRPRTRKIFTDDDMRRMRDLYYDRDVPMTRVADAFGVPVSTFLRWIAEMDWPRRSSGFLVEASEGGGSTPQPDPPPRGGREQVGPADSIGADTPAGMLADKAGSLHDEIALSAAGQKFGVNKLAVDVATAARRELAAMGDVTGPMTLVERKRRADIIASLSRSIARLDKTFEAQVERTVLQRKVERLTEMLEAEQEKNSPIGEAERMIVGRLKRIIEVSRARESAPARRKAR